MDKLGGNVGDSVGMEVVGLLEGLDIVGTMVGFCDGTDVVGPDVGGFVGVEE